jgi:tRNA(Ile)-lysidine synthase
LRGAGTAGLAGIRPVTRDGRIRPLIEIDREEVRAWLRERGIPWREDSSNTSPNFARNRIRHQLLPQLSREWNPAIEETLAQTADWALAEEQYWKSQIDQLAAECLRREPGGAILVPVEALSELPLAVARRLMRRAIELAKGDLRSIDFGHIGRVLDLARGAEGGRVQAPELEICRSFEWIRLARHADFTPYRLEVAIPGKVIVPGTGFAISLELIDKKETKGTGDSVYNGGMACLDWKRLSGRLELRNWQPGDRYRRVGASGEEKIKNLFQSGRVPLWERGQWPVLSDGQEIVWVRQFGAAAGCAAGPESGTVLRVQEVTAR